MRAWTIAQRKQAPGLLCADVDGAAGLDGIEIHVAAVIYGVGCPRFELDDADHGPHWHDKIRRKVD